MNVQELKKLLEGLIYCLRASLIARLTMEGTLRAAAKKSRLLQDWEGDYKAASMNPSALIAKKVDDQLRPLE
jgi:hypothetical protein